MRRTTAIALSVAAVAFAVAATEIPDWHAPVKGTQVGPVGVSMVQFANTSPWRVEDAPTQPDAPAATGGPAATATYKNVTVLTDVSAAEFDRLQTAMTAWVSPKQGCGFCHVGTDFVSDDNPMKNVTRGMLRMTRYINTTWKDHNGEQGVTCFSCHRGEAVPPETWFPSRPTEPRGLSARSENWDESADTVRKFFPDNGWSLYFHHDEPIRAQSMTALHSDTVSPQVGVKRVYEMMMQMSDGIGVNCGYCHNTRAFQDWSQSTPARWVAYDAFRMMREVNNNFLLGLRDTFPQNRELVKINTLALPPKNREAQPAFGLANCATCHYGHIKPDVGAATLTNYSALGSTVNAQPLQAVAATPGASSPHD